MNRREVRVIECLSELGEASARQVTERLAGRKPLVHWRVQATLVDLRRRGLLSVRRQGYATVYRPLVGPGELPGCSVAGLLLRLLMRSALSLLSSFVPPMGPAQEERALPAFRKLCWPGQ
jgi:predicted transcriptional regulator